MTEPVGDIERMLNAPLFFGGFGELGRSSGPSMEFARRLRFIVYLPALSTVEADGLRFFLNELSESESSLGACFCAFAPWAAEGEAGGPCCDC